MRSEDADGFSSSVDASSKCTLDGVEQWEGGCRALPELRRLTRPMPVGRDGDPPAGVQTCQDGLGGAERGPGARIDADLDEIAGTGGTFTFLHDASLSSQADLLLLLTEHQGKLTISTQTLDGSLRREHVHEVGIGTPCFSPRGDAFYYVRGVLRFGLAE